MNLLIEVAEFKQTTKPKDFIKKKKKEMLLKV